MSEYLLVHQDRRRVERYSKQDDGSGWLPSEHSGDEAVVDITRLGLRIELAELYASALRPGLVSADRVDCANLGPALATLSAKYGISLLSR